MGDMVQVQHYKMKTIFVLMSMWLVSQMFFIGMYSPNVGFRPDRALFFLIVALFVIHVARKEIKISGLGPEEVCMAIFTLLCSVSLIQSGANEDLSDGENKWLNALFNITYFPFITYFIAKRVEYNKQRTKILLAVLCGVGGYLGFTGICEHFGFEALVWPKYIMDPSIGTHWERVRGPFLESVAMGRILTVTLLCVLIMATEVQGFKKGVLYVIALLEVGSIYFTYTRGPWIGFGAALLIICTLRSRMRRPGLVLIVAILIVGLLGVGSKFSFFGEDTLFSRRQNTVDERMVSYATALKMGMENPMFGVGFGRFGVEWDNYFTPMPGPLVNPETMSHNTFLGIFAETGMPALAFLLAMLYQLLKMCLAAYRKLDAVETFERSLVVMVLGIGLTYITTGFVSDLRWNLLQNNLVFLFFGIVASLMGRRSVSTTLRDELYSGPLRQDTHALSLRG
jgi:O-antigen ligase